MQNLFDNIEGNSLQFIPSFDSSNEINTLFPSISQYNDRENSIYQINKIDFGFQFKDKEIESIELNNNEFSFENNKVFRGRKRKTGLNNNKKQHTKYDLDNIERKIQTHYQTFIANFVNQVLENLGYDEQFYQIDYKCKQRVNKQFMNYLKKSNIGTVLCQNISPKFSREKNKEKNLNVFNKVINYPVINNLLLTNYLDLFKDVYYKSERIVNLNKYNLNINIKLNEKIQLYIDLLNKNICKENNDYIKILNEYVKNNFLNDCI